MLSIIRGMVDWIKYISDARSIHWLIGIVPSVITFFTTRWFFNRKVLQELREVKNAISPSKYTGETWFEWKLNDLESHGELTIEYDCNKKSTNIHYAEVIKSKQFPNEGPHGRQNWFIMVVHDPIETNKISPDVYEVKNQNLTLPCSVTSKSKYHSILEITTVMQGDRRLQSGQKYKITF